MDLKRFPRWFLGLACGFLLGALLWTVYDVRYIGFIPKMLLLGVAYSWKIINRHVVAPIFGWSPYNILDLYALFMVHRAARPIFLIAILSIIGALILCKKKRLRIIGYSLLILTIFASLFVAFILLTMTE